MSGAERVVHIHVAEGGERLAELGIPPLFAGGEAGVFEQDALAGFAGGDFCLRVRPDGIGGERHFIAEQFVEPVRDGLQGEFFDVALRLFDIGRGSGVALGFGKGLDCLLLLFVELDLIVEHIVRLTHMGAQDDLRALFHQVPDGGESADDAVFIGDLAVLHRYVEIAADEDTLAFDVYIGDRLLVHCVYSFGFLFHI